MTDQAEAIKLVAVVAMAANRVIGKDGGLPWHLSEDLKFFKRLTSGHPIVMGRKTYESIGRPLPKRQNIVLSRTLETAPDGCDLIRSTDELGPSGLALTGTVYIIGGAQIYAALLDQLDEIVLTYVFDEYEGDTFLPEFEQGFEIAERLLETDQFEVRRYTRKA